MPLLPGDDSVKAKAHSQILEKYCIVVIYVVFLYLKHQNKV